MHQQVATNHFRIKRSFVERDPALINLPVPLPSIPLIAPLVGGSDPSPSPSQPTGKPVKSPPPTSNGNGNGGNGDGGSGGGSNSDGPPLGGAGGAGDNTSSGGGATIPADASTTASTIASTTTSDGNVPTRLGAVNAVSDAQSTGSSSPSITSFAGVQNSGGVYRSGSISDGSSVSTTSGSTPANISKHGLSAGGIFAIVVVLCLLLLGLTLVIIRRRNIARRSERRDKWFGGAFGYGSTRDTGSNYGADSMTGRTVGATVGSGTASVRSSFGTNIDHGLRLTTDLSTPFNVDNLLPKFPDMAEVNQNAQLINTSRFSTGSNNNSSSQYLAAPALVDTNTPPETASMSVRPFSPSESFAFPCPPSSETDANRSKSGSPSIESGRTLTPKQIHTTSSNVDTHPFADSTSVNAGSNQNPFVDSFTTAPAPDPTAEFGAMGVIRRPFAPTLGDELAVEPGESVRIAKLFDDGWAYVEKIGTSTGGLVPIDCMRDPGQDLPAFLAAKRVSSYYAIPEVHMGPVMAHGA